MSVDSNSNLDADSLPVKENEPTGLSPGKRRLFIAISLLFPVVFLLLLEVALRLSGYGGYRPAIRPLHSEGDQTVVITDTFGAASYFDQSKTGPGSMHQFNFLNPKPDATYRVVLVGGSAIKGFPQPRGFASSSFLQVMLGDLWPDKQVEVINLGTTAVASFPAMDMLGEMLRYEPDLVVVYSGHNEFFGAYGVASRHYAANSPWMMKLTRFYGGTALGQLIGSFAQSRQPLESKALMQAVVGKASIAPDSPLRARAAANLKAHVGAMIRACQRMNVPVMVCTLASNEQDFAPVGRLDPEAISEAQRSLLDQVPAELQSESEQVALQTALEGLLPVLPDSPLLHYRLGQVLAVLNDPACVEHFQKAIDLDRMPWRAPSASIDALKSVANEYGTALCDVQSRFRAASPLHAIDRDLLDDHVHPTLKGQWLMARSMLETMAVMDLQPDVTSEAVVQLPGYEHYAVLLGVNDYDRLSVQRVLSKVFEVPFVSESNPDRLKELQDAVQSAMNRLSAPELQQFKRWTHPESHPGYKIPLSGMIAPVKMREQQLNIAEQLFWAARRHVPTYSGPQFEYTTYALACRQQLRGELSPEDQQIARETLTQIRLFLALVEKSSGQPERFMGRLHQLLGEHEQAIEQLLIARQLLIGDNLVKVEMALVASYAQIGDIEAARKILTLGMRRGGPSAGVYRQMLMRLGSGG
jgi:tetratricopeptide (TPR) repeat protein